MMLTHVLARPPAEAGFRLHYRNRSTPDGLDCWLAIPARMDVEAAPLVAVHGIRRGAREQAALFGARAAAAGRVVVAPLFDRATWPRYQQLVKKGRADRALIALTASLRREGMIAGERFELFGFSGGAQFAHRFAMLRPERVTRLTVAAAGWYTFPDEAVFPYGFGDRRGAKREWGARMRERFDAFARIPVNAVVGARDCLIDQNTRAGEAIDEQQGRTRLVRAGNWAKAIRREALRRDIAPNVNFFILPGCGHRFRACIEVGELDRIVVPAADLPDGAESAGPECFMPQYGNGASGGRAQGAIS